MLKVLADARATMDHLNQAGQTPPHLLYELANVARCASHVASEVARSFLVARVSNFWILMLPGPFEHSSRLLEIFTTQKVNE